MSCPFPGQNDALTWNRTSKPSIELTSEDLAAIDETVPKGAVANDSGIAEQMSV